LLQFSDRGGGAHDVLWKVSPLLDSYQPEREPNVRGVIAMAMMMGQTVSTTDPAAACSSTSAPGVSFAAPRPASLSCERAFDGNPA
jgi:hypothetical protein